MTYPTLRVHLHKEVLIEHFTLSPEDRELLTRIRNDTTRLGFAVLLKAFMFLGYPPRQKTDVPDVIVNWIACHMAGAPESFGQYIWKDRLWDLHLSLIRKYTGFRPFEPKDFMALLEWLVERGNEFLTRKDLMSGAVRNCREFRLELPTEPELWRLVNSARRQFFSILYETVSGRLSPEVKELMDRSMRPADSEETPYERMKSPPGPLELKTILEEIEKLRLIREFGLDPVALFAGYSEKILRRFKDRVRAEDVAQIRRHQPAVRYTLFSVLLHARGMEVTDNVVQLFLDLIRRVQKKTDKALEKDLIREIIRVRGKMGLLFRVAHAATENPDGTIRQVLFPVVEEDVLLRLVEESRLEGTSYPLTRAMMMRKKYINSYRRMMKPALGALTFRSSNPAHRPILEGLALMHRYLETKHTWYPENEDIPQEILTGSWKEMVMEDGPQGPRAVKHYLELCVMEKLERAVRCKEVWVERAYRFRNPDEDLPADWEGRRVEYYRRRGLPLSAEEFLEPLRDEMTSTLETFNSGLPKNPIVRISHPGGGERGFFNISKVEKRPDRPLIQDVKSRVLSHWGILDLLDILLEADRQVNFSRFFHTSGARQVLGREEVRERLLLILFGLGTNLGLARIHSAAKPSCSYDDLRYFRSRYVSVEAVREAIVALVNRVLEIRNPVIWGRGTACASDAKHLEAWDQNLTAEWNPHYGRTGVMVYWLVDTNALCIYSQIRGISETAAMIKALVSHDTEMRVESNFVDSHGQSEVAFAFCRLLGVKLMPRLKRIKYETLYLPEKGMGERLPNLAGVLARPIRWDLIRQQYDDLVRHVVAVAEDTAPVDSILRRFNRYNRSNPTYRAFVELGKAEKTIFLSRYLPNADMQREVHAGLNVVENWNSCNDFVSFGRKADIPTNDPVAQELAVLCQHLLQNALILANTIMVERVLEEHALLERMEPEDFQALTPLFTLNVNPYGDFELDLSKPSFLEVS